eukprot:scaffold267899_cov38-Prasinocladus_malaysianus.AAC.1
MYLSSLLLRSSFRVKRAELSTVCNTLSTPILRFSPHSHLQLHTAHDDTPSHSPEALTDQGLKALSELPRLESLTLSRCSGISNGGVPHLTRLKGSLTKLDLAYCSGLSEGGLSALSSLAKLTSLNVSCCKVIAKNNKKAGLLSAIRKSQVEIAIDEVGQP